jgi:hypothetical protein
MKIRRRRSPSLVERSIPFVNNVKYLGLIFNKKTTWRTHIKTIEAKAFRAFIRTYSLFKSEWLSANIKLTLHKVLLIRSILTYACPAWEFSADTHLLKLQCLKNKVLHTIDKYPRYALDHKLLKDFNIPYIYDYITKLCRQQAEIIQNHGNSNAGNLLAVSCLVCVTQKTFSVIRAW